MQQSPIAKKLQSGSIFCFWFLGTASRGCHGWNDSGLAHAPSGKLARKHDGEASDHTKRTTHWSNTRPALRIVPDAALREAQPYSSNKPEARFWSLLLFLFKQKKPPEGGLSAKALTGFIRAAFCTDDYWYRASFQWCPCRSHLLDQSPMHTSLLL